MHDEGAQITGVQQHVAHDAGVGHARLAVAEGDGASPLQQADLRHLVALQALGHGRHDVDVHERVVARAALDEVDQRHLVDDGLGIGHHHHGGHAAGRRGLTGGLERLAVLLTGLAGEDLHVDETGAKHVAPAVDDAGSLGRGAAQVRPEVGDQAVAHQGAAGLVASGRRVDQASVEERDRLGLDRCRLAHVRGLTG
jgi:hypothetical protein